MKIKYICEIYLSIYLSKYISCIPNIPLFRGNKFHIFSHIFYIYIFLFRTHLDLQMLPTVKDGTVSLQACYNYKRRFRIILLHLFRSVFFHMHLMKCIIVYSMLVEKPSEDAIILFIDTDIYTERIFEGNSL